MLKFSRPAFKSGIMYIRYDLDGEEQILALRPTDLDGDIDVGSPQAEAAVRQNHGRWMLTPAEHAARGPARSQAKANREKLVF